MKKEPKKSISNIFLKFIALLMLIAAAILVHFEYIINKTPINTSKAQILNVRVETGENSLLEKSFEENILEEKESIIQNNQISSIVSEDFKVHAPIHVKLEEYRIYLFSVICLAQKFLQHEDYQKEIELLLINKDIYPDDILKIIQDFENYRGRYLTFYPVEFENVELEGSITSKIINKIIDIKKKNPQYETNSQEFTKLKNELNKLIVYFYSKDFLKKYLGND